MSEKQNNQPNKYVSEEQLSFAKTLHIASIFAIAFLVISFIVYIFNFLPTIVSLSDVAKFWHLRVDEYVAKTGVPTGWEWVKYLGHGDMIAYGGLVLLATICAIPFFIIIPIFIKKKDVPFIIIAVLQIIVFILAAGNFVSSGH